MPTAGPPRDLAAELARGEIAPLYCLGGREKFLVTRALDALRAAVLDPASRDFNQDLLDAKVAGPAGILAAARTLPMLAQRRLVVVRGIDELRSQALEELLPYVAAPAPSSVLLFLAEKVDTRLKFFQALKKSGALVVFDPPRDRELPAFVVAEARARGGAIEQSAARLLAELVGSDLGALAQAIEKLLLYVGAGRRIGEEEVALCIAETRVRSVFDLINAVGEGSRERALRHLRRMLEERESPLGIVAMLLRHFRQLWVAQELLTERASKSDVASALGLNPYFVDGVIRQARRFSVRALRRAFEQLYEADLALKSSKLGDEVILERLILTLAG